MRPSYQGMARATAWLVVGHPVPSALNAIVVAGLALVAGADGPVAASLALAMFAFQVSIGALNDVVDAEGDRLVKPAKPIPSGLVSRGAAIVLAVVAGAIGLVISAGFGPLVLAVGAAGYGCGLAYDLYARRIGLGWVTYAVAFPALLAWTWLAAAGTLPPGWPLLLPLAALAGPMIHLANSLVDLDEDRQAARPSLATRLGPGHAYRSLVALAGVVYLLAWAALVVTAAPSPVALITAIGATLIGSVGLALSGRSDRRSRETGWLLQGAALGIFAIAWAASLA